MSEAETSKTDKKKVEPERIPNAWLINSDSRVEGYILRMDASKASMKGVHDGDYVAVVSDDAGSKRVTRFARIHRIRTEQSSVSLYFDAADALSTSSEPALLGLSVPSIPVERLEWDRFVKALSQALGKSPEQLEGIKDQCYIRRLLQLAVKDDLLGPANGPLEEVVGMSVRDRYIVGRLAPKILSLERKTIRISVLRERLRERRNQMPQETRHWFPHRLDLPSVSMGMSKN